MSFSFTLATHSFRRSVVKLPSPLHHLAGFNAFWYAHHLLVFAYILLVMHSYFIFLTKQWYKRTVFFLFVKCPDVSPFEWYCLIIFIFQLMNFQGFGFKISSIFTGIPSPSLLHLETIT